MFDFYHARQFMVHKQIKTWYVSTAAILDILSAIPREYFVPRQFKYFAYADTFIPLGDNQHMLAPRIIGRILEALQVTHTSRVLEIGTGSGYLTVALSHLAQHIDTFEIRKNIFDHAQNNISHYFLDVWNQISWYQQDAFLYLNICKKKYDIIVLNGATHQSYVQLLVNYLHNHGRIFNVVGTNTSQTAFLHQLNGQLKSQTLFDTVIDYLDNEPYKESFIF